jgi:N,N'-diacetyllegionaminate synthase
MSEAAGAALAARPPRLWPERSGSVVIAEVAQAHDGSLGMAHAYVDAAADAGADAIKFQTHIAAAESTAAEPWRVRFSRQDETRLDYWRRMEFTPEQWAGLREHARSKGLLFLSSAFSEAATDLLARIGVDGWKIASGEVGNTPLLERMTATPLPVLLSTGMSPWAEIDVAVAAIRARALPLAVLQCTSIYPTPPEKLGLNVIGELRRRYGCAVGLSDHSGTIHAGLAAAALGCEVLELHVTFDRRMFGPDVPASVTIDELRTLAEGIRFIERARANPVDKDGMARELAPLRGIFTKSIVAARDLEPGIVLERAHLAFKKPGTGLPPARLSDVVGRRLARAVKRDAALAEEDLA